MSKSSFRDYPPGAAIGHAGRTYRLGEKMAQGPFGALFAGRDDWGAEVVVRVVWPFSRTYASVRERWLQLGAELQRSSHPNLVHVYDAFEHEGCFHLVLERCDHRLDGYLVLPAWNGLRWLPAVASSVLRGLDHLHRAGYHHRNLAAHNVLCTVGLLGVHPAALPPGAIKIGDFGLTPLLGNVDVMNTQLAKSLTPPEYLNPSQFGLMDQRVDIYQAGLLLLAVLLGRLPHFTYEQIAAGAPQQTAAGLACGFARPLARALAPQVAERYPGALDFWQELSGCRQSAAAEPAAKRSA